LILKESVVFEKEKEKGENGQFSPRFNIGVRAQKRAVKGK